MELKRKIKKKFDNIVADARRKCRLHSLSSDEKVKDEVENANEMNKEKSNLQLNDKNDTSKLANVSEEHSFRLFSMKPLKRRIHKFWK
jgi:hypothetical protein